MPGAVDVGSTFDAYEILALLARGGMANVWLARQRMKHGLETLVAIKTVLPEYSMDPKFQAMFLDEARIACRIDHPNVARLLDVGEAFGHSYIVMEYVGGESLSRLRRAFARANKMIPLAIAMRVVADLCAGLHAAHELVGPDGQSLHVVHRDVSPQNVLLSDSGVVKLIDFGVAKARGRLGSDTSAGFAKGKARYMAPEQASGLGLDRRADVWAAGAVLYELLSGKTPLDGPNDMAVLKNLLTDAVIDPLPTSVPERARAIVERALQKSSSDRYATAAMMRDAIEDAMSALGLRASAGDIERVLRENLATRIDERKATIEAAARAADARAIGSHVPVVDESSADLPRPEHTSDASVAASTTQVTAPAKRRWWPLPLAGIATVAVALAVGYEMRKAPPAAATTVATPPSAATSAPAATAIISAAPPETASMEPATTAASSAPHAPAHTHPKTSKPHGHDWGGIE